MGIFLETKKCFNRAPVPLEIRFDGQEFTAPALSEFAIPEIVIPFAKNQHPIMGSVDPYNPSMSGGKYLIGVVGKDDCTPLTKKEWNAHLEAPTREDQRIVFADKYGNDPKARMVVMGKGRKSTASSRTEAGGSPRESGNVTTAYEREA